MKWAKPNKGQFRFPDATPFDKSEHDLCVESDDFNAPLLEQRSNDNGGSLAIENRREIESDDLAEAERRLADGNDRIVPFRPSR
jgi:hypothetical protein